MWTTTDTSGKVIAKSPTYSGDAATYYGGSHPYSFYNGVYSGGGPGSCGGQIKALFTWQSSGPDDPPPPQVLTVQTSTAALGGGSPNGGKCADGLGNPQVGGMSQGTLYAVANSSSTVEVDCTPTASIGSGASYCDVTYSAAIYPVTVNLGGGIGPSTAKRLLVGQQLGATLGAGPLTQTSWNWSASGGAPFKNYVANDAKGVYTPLASETNSQLVCNLAQPTTGASVSCTAHLAVPTGASPAAGLDVTATQAFIVEKPSAMLDVFMGTVADLPTSINPTAVQLQKDYYSSLDGRANGIAWKGTITTPATYVFSGDYGTWNYTQLLNAARQQKNNGVYWQLAVNTTTPATLINGSTVLDGTYPYAYSWYPSNGTRAGSADSPAQGLDSNTAVREYDVSDSFNDYLMYLPPGSGSLPVPLKLTNWYWNFQALKDATNAWSTSSKNASWGFVGDFPAFPTWTFNAAIDHIVYAAP